MNEINEWIVAGIVVTIIAGGWGIVTAASGIIKPLTEQLTKLNDAIHSITEDLNELSTRNSKTHGKLFEAIDALDNRIDNHEIRLVRMEEHDRLGQKRGESDE